MSPPFVLLLLLVGFCAAKDTTVFYGGSMSFATYRDHADNDTLKVHIKLLTGWKTGKGPCGVHCPRSRTRSSTLQSRKSMLLANGEEYFGTWEMEWKDKHDVAHTNDTSPIVAANLTEKVESVNPMAEWELDTADIFIPIPEEIQYVDIIYEGHSWLELTLNKPPTQPPKWHMQVKVNSHSRSDTKHPNRSPVVQMKPFFKLGMNRTYNIHLTAIDEDDDAIFCRFSQYVEAGSAISLHTLPNTVVDKESCSISVDTSDSGIYMENSTGVIAVTVIDYPPHLVALHGEDDLKMPYTHVLSAVTVQFFVFIVEHADEPIFVDPTPSNRQTFVIYVGVEFTVDYYARPTSPDPARKIEMFDVTRTGGRETNQTAITYLGSDRKAKITVTWVPTEADTGKDILCARVEDNFGFESVDLHCFTIVIKSYTAYPQNQLKGLPYFVHFPQPGDIVFPEHSYCKFPIYAASSVNGGITNISILSTDAPSAILIGALRPVNDSLGPGAKMVQVQLKESLGGVRKICFEAADATSSTVQCLFANVLKKDPCAVTPCLSDGHCIPSEDHESFYCHCRKGFSGKTCKQAPPPVCSGTDPCLNGGRCIRTGPVGYFCLCSPEYTGINCENKVDKCNLNPCGSHGICIDGDSITCNCTEGYKGPYCNVTQTCTGYGICNGCSSGMCQNGGICRMILGQQKCLCPVGFTGTSCENTTVDEQLKFVPPTPGKGSRISCNIRTSKAMSPICEFSVYLQASAPPSLGSVVSNTELEVTILSAENASLPGLRHVYMIPVKLSQINDIKSGAKYDFCLKARLLSKEVYRCFSVDYEALPSPKTIVRNAWEFIPPTPEKNTKFSCIPGSYCHIVVYTRINDTDATKCEQVLVTTAHGGKAFPTESLKNKCLTDVVFTDINSEGNHQVCLKSWKYGESRCYLIEVIKNTTDVCDANPCLNGGLCNQKNSTSYSCICKQGYSGINCGIGPCPSADSQCQNGAYCYRTGTRDICFCRIGYSGTNCTHESSENITDLHNNGGEFTDAVYPTNITCYVSKPCRIPHIITGSPAKEPQLRPGYVSSDVTIEEVKIEKHPNSTQTYHSITVIKAETTGQKKVCVQIYNEQRLTSDEVCFNVTVTEGFEHKNQILAHFLPPTPPNNTGLECQVGRPCHLMLWTSNRFGINSCPLVKSNKKPGDSVYIFQQTGKSSPCVNEVSMQIQNVGKTPICFTAITLDINNPQGDEGDTRCFHLEIVTSLTVKSSCSNVKCANGGFCDSITLTGECRCVLGFSGRHCEIPKGVSLIPTPQSATQSTAMMTDMAIPDKIICHLNEKCDIPFSITANSNTRPSVNFGHYDESLTVTTPTLHKDQHTSLNTYIGHVTVAPNQIGSHIVCIQMSMDKVRTSDEQCVDVIVPSNEAQMKVNKNLPHYDTPTLPNNTQVACTPTKTCHIILSISPGLHKGCPNIKRTSGNPDFAHVFHSNTNDKVIGNCTADVAITPSANHNNSDMYCFELSFPSVPGEKRCLNITYQVPEQSPCVGQKCENGGFCYSRGNITACRCPITSSGATCGLPGSQRLNISSIVFGTFAVPTFFTCERLVTCDLPVTINGNLKSRDVDFGFVSKELSMEIRRISQPAHLTTDVRMLDVKVTGKENGTFYACIQFKSLSKVLEHCVTIQIIDKDSNGTIGTIDKKKPHFENNIPSNTELHCEPEVECHILLQHEAKSGICDNVDGGDVPGIAHIMNSVTPDTNGICQTDVLVMSNTSRTGTVCLTISDDSTTGETRCFKLAVNNKTYESTCVNVTCLNSGYCVGDLHGISSCICPGGHTGVSCSLDGGILPTNHTQYSTPGPGITPKFIDTAVPDILPCKVDTECGISLLVKGEPQLKPDLKTSSPIVKTPIETDSIPSSNGTYIAGVRFHSNKTGIQTVCVNTVFNRNKGDELCFKVNITDSSYTPPSIENGHTPHINMKEPTIPDGASVKCEEDTSCHLIIRLEKYSDGRCLNAKVTPTVPNTRIVKTYQTSNTCVADIVSITHKGDVNKTVCVQIDGTTSSYDREKRCVTINTVEHIRGSPCNEKYCNGEGYCQTNSFSEYTCLCKLGFEGTDCEIAVEPTPIPREKNDSTIQTPLFVDSVLPKEIKCHLMQDCPIIIPINGFQLNQSSVAFGHFDNGLIPGQISVENITDPANQILAQFHLKATEEGMKYVCLQSRNLNKNTDEMCVKIVVTNETASTSTVSPPSMTPQIVEPTLPTGSVVQCEFGGNGCHIHLITQPAFTSNQCPEIEKMVSSTITKVHSFTSEHPLSSINTCHVDVSFKPDVPGNHTLCVKAKYNSYEGDQRCYIVKVVTSKNKTYGGPCQNHQCYNKGRCEADPVAAMAICICPIGLSGTNCQTTNISPKLNSVATTISTIATHIFTDTAIPDVIQCPINTSCGIPLIITGPPGSIPNVNTDSPLVNQPIPTHTFTGSSNTTYQTDVNVFSTKAGLHNVCTHIGTNGDEICFKVNITLTKNTSANILKNIQEPTIPDLSSVKCLENTVCHLLIHSSMLSNGSCIIPKQSPQTTGTVILKTDVTTFNQSLCVTDVATLVKPGKQTIICLETSRCDSRCIEVNAVKSLKNSSPCNSNPCQENGFCRTTDYVTHICVCKTGFEGKNCETKVKPMPIPRHNNSTVPSPVFVDTMLPKELTCYVAQDCPIILPVYGQPLNKSSVLFGHLDQGVIPGIIKLENVTNPLNQTIAHFHVTPSEPGIKHLCVQASNLEINTDEVCIKVTILSQITTTSPPMMTPKITSPSFLNGTVLQCEYGDKSCHIPIYTMPTPGSNKCPKVENMASSSIANVYAFSSENCLGCMCHMDLSVKPDVPGNHTLCVRAIDQSKYGDVICYTIQVVTGKNKTFGGPCQQKHCYNKGRCEADPVFLSSKCICPVEYSSTNCLSNVSIIPTSPGSSVSNITKPVFTDTAIPDVIQCHVGTTCSVPLIIKGGVGAIPQVETDSVLVNRPIQSVLYPEKRNNTFQTNIKVSGSKEGLHTVCTHIVDNRDKGDEICFKLNITAPVTTSLSGNNMDIQEPTLPDMSSVKCLEGVVCHVLVHTSKANNGSCLIPKQSPYSTGTVVLKSDVTTFDPSLCVTDIATIVKHGETKKICVDIHGSTSTRCIIVNSVKNLTKSHCNGGKPCNGNGYCRSVNATSYLCVCKLGFKGLHCDTSAQPVPIPRRTNNSSMPTPLFVNTMLPKELTCQLNKDCPIMLPIQGSPVNESSLLFGHMDKGIEPGQIKLVNISTPFNQCMAQFHVKPSEIGRKFVCVQAQSSEMNTDEICINIIITPDNALTTISSIVAPEIISPSLPNGTVLQCENGPDGCHIQLVTKPTPGSISCPTVENTQMSSLSNVHGFTSEAVASLASACYVDLSVKPDYPGNHTLCIKAREKDKTGNERCYTIQVVTNANETFGGPCQDIHCYNGGRCEADSTSQSTCVCPVEYFGSDCRESRIPPLTHGNMVKSNITTPTFTGTAIPDVIQCTISTPCGIPLIVTGPPGYIPTVDTDSPYVIHPVKTDTFPGKTNTTFQTNIKIFASKEGQHKICASVFGKKSKGDEICFQANFTSVTSTASPTINIQEPTIPDTSSVKCLEGTVCHLLVHTSKDNSGNCIQPRVLPHTPGTFVISTEQTTLKPQLCVTDIATKVNHGETKKICVGTARSSAEKRCVTINPTSNSTTSNCQQVSCNGGHCLSTNQFYLCVCPVGYSGKNCQNKALHVPIPRIDASNITTNSTVFVNTGVPSEVNCNLNQPCEFPLPISGQNLSNKSLTIGYKDPTLENCQATLKGANVKIASFCIKPTQVGNQTICVQTRNILGVNVDEVCLKIHTNSGLFTTATSHNDYITRPSYTDGSVVKCVVDSTCYIPMITDPASNPPCPSVKPTERNGLENVHAFTPSTATNGKCFGNIAIIPRKEEMGRRALCFQTVTQTGAGPEHCLVIDVVNSASETTGGPCQTTHCEHFSPCISDVVGNTAICNCSGEYTGNLCEQIGTTQDITKAPASSPRSSDTIDSILISDAATQEIITTSLSVYSSNQHPVNTSPVSLHLPQTCDISLSDANKAAKYGRVRCTCHNKGKTTHVITTNPRATLDQLLKAAGIGAGSVGGSIVIATLIYVIVQKIRKQLKPKAAKRPTKYI